MSIESKSTCTVISWKDRPSRKFEGGAKLTRTRITLKYEGAISGNGVVEYLMCNIPGGVTHYVGFECITGTLDGRTGSFVVRHEGSFLGSPRSTFTVVTDSGTGQFAGIVGKGSYALGHGAMDVLFSYYVEGSPDQPPHVTHPSVMPPAGQMPPKA